MSDKNDRLTPNQVRHRTIDIRISGDPELIAAYADELVNTSEKIGREVIKWTGPFESKSISGIQNMFLEVVPGRNHGNPGK